MRRASLLLALALSLPIASGAQEKPPSPGLAYLLDDAVRIYVIDESRCSAKPDSKEGGRWYVIEGEENLRTLREMFAAVDLREGGMCSCGGPDIHFYAEAQSGHLTYFGLDCEKSLAGIEIPDLMQDKLIPARRTFLGKRMGETYIVDIPFEIEEPAAREGFQKAGFVLLTGGWWNMATEASPRESVRRWRQMETAPAYLRLEIGPLTSSRPEPERPVNATPAIMEAWRARYYEWDRSGIAETDKAAQTLADAWVDGLAIRGALLFPAEVQFSGSSGDERTYRAELYFKEAGPLRAGLASKAAVKPGISLAEIQFRTDKEFAKKFSYQAALLLSENPAPEEIAKAKSVLPGIGRVVPLCECREKPRG